MRNAPEIVEVDNTQLEEVLRRVEQSLDEKDATLIRAVFESYVYVTDLVEDKNTSIRRLRQLFFGARTEKTDAVVGRQAEKPEATPPNGAAADTELAAGEAGHRRVERSGRRRRPPQVTGATAPTLTAAPSGSTFRTRRSRAGDAVSRLR